MSVQINLPAELYARVRQIAERKQQDVDQVIADLLDEAVASAEDADMSRTEAKRDPAVEREKRAYIAMHPTLVQDYLGKYVAIHGGELVDFDDDFSALLKRIERAYPNTFVWLTKVGPEPIRTIVHRSPRLLQNVKQ